MRRKKIQNVIFSRVFTLCDLFMCLTCTLWTRTVTPRRMCVHLVNAEIFDCYMKSGSNVSVLFLVDSFCSGVNDKWCMWFHMLNLWICAISNYSNEIVKISKLCNSFSRLLIESFNVQQFRNSLDIISELVNKKGKNQWEKKEWIGMCFICDV